MQRLHQMRLYLPPDLRDALDRLALQRGTSRSELVRLAARRFVELEQSGVEDAIVGLIGLSDAGPGNASVRHDHLLSDLAPSRFAPWT